MVFKIVLFILLTISSFATDIFTKEELEYIKNNPEVTVGMLNNFKPFSYFVDGKHQGLSVDIIKDIEKVSRLKFNIKTQRWTPTLNDFKDKKVDIITDISHTKKREDFTLFSDIYHEIPTYIFGLKKDTNYKDIYSLKDKKVGISRSIFYKDSFITHGIKVYEYSSSIEKVKALAVGDIDYFTASYSSGRKAINSQFITNIKPLGELDGIKKEDLRIGVNKDKPILYSIINKSLNQISKEKLSILTNRWVMQLEDQVKRISFTDEELDFIKNNPIITVHNEQDWAPYNYNEDNQPKGFSIDYIELVAKKIGLNIEYITNKTWNQYIDMVKMDQLDVMLNIAKTPQREEFLSFTKPYIKSTDVLFINSSNKDTIESLKDCDGKTIAVVKGFYEEDLLKNHYPSIKLKVVNSTLEALKAVSFGKADGSIHNYSVASYLLAKNSISNVKAAFEIADKRFGLNLYIATSKNNPILNSILLKGIENLDQSEVLKLKQKMLNISQDILDKKNYLTKDEKDYLRDKKTFTMCNNLDYAPIEFSIEIEDDRAIHTHKMGGISIDILKKIEDKLDIKFEHIHTDTWDQALQYLKENRCDILPSAVKTKKREDFANFTTPYLTLDLAILTKKDKPFVNSFGDLDGKTIARKSSSALVELLKDKHPTINLKLTDSTKESFLSVSQGKAYATIASIPVATYMIKRYGIDNLQISGYSNINYPLSIAVSKEDQLLYSILNKTIKHIPKTVFQTQLNRWTDIKIEQKINYDQFYKFVATTMVVLLLFIYWNRKLSKERNIANEAIKDKNRSLQQLSLAFDIAHIGSFQLDFEKNIIYCDEMICTILNTQHSKKDLEYDMFLKFIPEFEKDKLNTALQNAIDTKTEQQINYYIKREDDTLRYIAQNFKVVEYTKDDKPYLLIGTMVDITDQKNLEDSLRDAKNKAEELTHIKSSFLANMSHEIRTPMNSIIGMIHLVKNSPLNSTQKDYLSKIESSSKNLLEIINDILDFSKIEANRLTIEKINFNLLDTIENVKAMTSIKADEKSLQLKVKYNIEEMLIYTDPLRLTQILINLTNNAIKFTQQGSIEIIISRTDKEHLLFEIKDTGIGITKDQQQKLFQSFSQADQSITRKYGGTGLGLAISKELVTLLGGHIWVESEVGKGSSFLFELPAPTMKMEYIKDEEDNKVLVDISHLKNTNILLVEDNDLNIDIVKSILEPYSINIDVAKNGKIALDRFGEHQHRYDIILMDIQMPIMDGYTATKHIRDIDKDIPIVVLSAHAMKEDIEKSLSYGVDKHLTKPIDIQELFLTLSQILSSGGDRKKVKSDIKIVEDIKKELTKEDKIKLFKELKKSITSRRPKVCESVVDKISQISLKQKEEELFLQIKGYIKKYNFNKALESMGKLEAEIYS